MDSSKDPVTIDRGYFETLVRRAQFNSDAPVRPEASITVSQADYDALRQIARHYANLRENLIRGGVGEDVIALLSQDDANHQQENVASTVAPSDKIDGGVRLRLASQVSRTTRDETVRWPTNGNSNGNTYSGHRNHGVRRHESQEWAEADPTPDDESCSVEAPADAPNGRVHNEQQPRQREQFERQCNRTVQMVNLPDGTLHRDITAAVRGGLLLDVFLRTHDRTATVSFLRAAEAQYFFDHAKKNDLYIKNKRVDVKWPERKFTLSGHVASKIGIGASRNLIIRRCDSRLTEKVIRDDLEHIHNLVVIKVHFSHSSCYISTNSIHNAMFARTCLMSRGLYKGSKIEWDVDECAQPYPPRQLRRESTSTAKKAERKFTNMYDILADTSAGDQDQDDDEHEISPGFRNPVGIAA